MSNPISVFLAKYSLNCKCFFLFCRSAFCALRVKIIRYHYNAVTISNVRNKIRNFILYKLSGFREITEWRTKCVLSRDDY